MTKQNNIAGFNLDADMGAAVAAESLGIGNAIYKDIPIGGRFRFKDSPAYVKTARGYREADNPNAPVFQTGQRTAVFRT